MATNFEAQLVHGEPLYVDFMPGADVAAGEVIVSNNYPMVATRDNVAGRLGALAARGGVYRISSGAVQFTAGQKLYWDGTNIGANGDHFGFAAKPSYDYGEDGVAPGTEYATDVIHAPDGTTNP